MIGVAIVPCCLTRAGAERRARTTAVAVVAAAQNGTSGVLAGGKHARRRAAWATPRTGVRGLAPADTQFGLPHLTASK